MTVITKPTKVPLKVKNSLGGLIKISPEKGSGSQGHDDSKSGDGKK